MTRIPCSVCKKPYDGSTHCSVNACMACAMFFKRSTKWSTMPKCRTGRNNCRLDKAGNITCSACRYNKCIEVGLKQKKNIRSLRNHQENLEWPTENNTLSIQHQVFCADTMPILNRFCHFYAHVERNKKIKEFAMLQSERIRISQLPGNRYMGRITYSLIEKILPEQFEGLIRLMHETFPAFDELDNACQETLIYRSMFPLFELAASFRNLRVLNDVNCRKVLCTETMYADLTNMTDFIEPSVFGDLMDYKTVLCYVSAWWNEFLDTTHRLMHRIQITDMEFLAICALTIWDKENFGENQQLSIMAEKHRRLIYKDLNYYYTNMLHLDNYVERIMNCKELIKILKVNTCALGESFHFLRTFNYYKGSRHLWNTALNIFKANENKRSQILTK